MENQLTLANRNNNPGNIRDTSTGKFKVYNSPQEGYAALLNDLETKKSGKSTTGLRPDSTLAEFASTYAPASDKNDPAQYTANLANHMGVRPDSKLSELDTGKWAEAIAKAEGYKGQSSISSATQNITPKKLEQPKKDFLQKAEEGISKFLPGQQVGQAIGTLGGLAYEKAKGFLGGQDNSQYYDTSAPTPLQTIGDVAQGALTVGAGLGGKSLGVFGKSIPTLKTAATTAGRIGQGAALGSGFGLTGGLKEGKTDATELAKDTAIGGITGGALGVAGEGLSKITQVLPKRIASSFLKGKGVGDKEIEYAMKKGLGSPTKMLSESESSISSMGSELDKILTGKQYADFKVPGRDILNKVVQDFPEAGLTRPEVIKKLQSIVPLKKETVAKLIKGDLTLKELHTLNSALGKNTFKTVFDGVEVKANKEIGSAVYHSISDIIKNVAPETKPIFSDLSKEYPLRSSLEQLIKKGEKSKFIDLNTILSFLGGSVVGSPLAGLGAVGLEKIATSPTVNLKTAGLLNKLGGKTTKQLQQGLKAPVTKGLSDLFRGNVTVR